jgi:hypothetical protein
VKNWNKASDAAISGDKGITLTAKRKAFASVKIQLVQAKKNNKYRVNTKLTENAVSALSKAKSEPNMNHAHSNNGVMNIGLRKKA